MIVGADPGINGGLGAYNWISGEIHTFRLPISQSIGESKKAHKPRLDTLALWRVVQAIAALEPVACVFEDVHGYGGQDGAASFQFGDNTATLRTCLEIAGFKMVYVPPSVWKPVLGVSKVKKKALERASDLMPQGAHRWPSVTNDDGLAEAALLAYYGAHILGLDGCPSTVKPKRPRHRFTAELLAGTGPVFDPVV